MSQEFFGEFLEEASRALVLVFSDLLNASRSWPSWVTWVTRTHLYWQGAQSPTYGQLSANTIQQIQTIFPKYKHVIQIEDDDDSEPIVNESEVHFNGIEDDGLETFVWKTGGGINLRHDWPD